MIRLATRVLHSLKQAVGRVLIWALRRWWHEAYISPTTLERCHGKYLSQLKASERLRDELDELRLTAYRRAIVIRGLRRTAVSTPIRMGVVKQALDDLAEARQENALLEVENRKLAKLSFTDQLTGLINRHGLEEYFAKEWGLLSHDPISKPVAIIVVDVDHFKKINDTYGHSGGDEVLKQLAQRLKTIARRSSDIICRFGGEEFVVVLFDTTMEMAYQRASKLAFEVRQAPFTVTVVNSQGEQESQPLSVTVSCGVHSILAGPVPAEDAWNNELFQPADVALYRAKKEGRDRVVRSDAP